MSIICNIIQKIINPNFFLPIQNNTSFEYWENIYKNLKNINTHNNSVQVFYLYSYISQLYYTTNNKSFIENKFFYLKEYLDNIFISSIQKEYIFDIFQKSQQTYYAFAKLANLYKYKKSTLRTNQDLYMNEINENQKNVYTIIQEGSKYVFLNSDLIKIVNSALLNSSHFFADPLTPKNPFNNLPFNNATLYNIYFHLRYNSNFNPFLFYLFFKANLNVDKFYYDNETIIRDEIIKNYVETSPPTVLHHDLKNMLSINYRYTKNIVINEDIPKDVIINIFRPYLHLYYLHRFGVCGTEKKHESYTKLKNKLKQFAEFNPQFGRKMG
jgi:hypothetical protein